MVIIPSIAINILFIVFSFNYILNPSFSPVISIQVPITDDLDDEHKLHFRSAGVVGDGAGIFRFLFDIILFPALVFIDNVLLQIFQHLDIFGICS